MPGLRPNGPSSSTRLSQFPRVAQRMFLISRQSRHQRRQSCEPGAIRPADKPEQETAQAARPVCAQCHSRLSRPRARPAQQAARTRRSSARSILTSRAWRRSPTPARPRGYLALDELWSNAFPMVLPPERARRAWDHLAELKCRHPFLVHQRAGNGVRRPVLGGRRRHCDEYPRACWIVCIHHHVIEYPRADVALSERIGRR